MIKTYIEDYSAVYEPAEGGYYVPVSTVWPWRTFNTFEEAVEAIKQEDERDPDTYKYLYDVHYNENSVALLNVEVGRDTGYIGEGQEIWVVDEDDPAPAPKVYNGYR